MRVAGLQCRTCLEMKPRSVMMFSSTGRVLGWCKACFVLGMKRCTTCDSIRPVGQFPHQVGFYDNGWRQYGTRCYDCQANSITREMLAAKGAKLKAHTLHAMITRNLRGFRRRARERSLPFDLDRPYLKRLWRDQDGRCFYTGVEMAFGLGQAGRDQSTASLDRLVPDDGYTKGNVVWCAYWANTAKGARTYAEFMQFCRLVLEHDAKREAVLEMDRQDRERGGQTMRIGGQTGSGSKDASADYRTRSVDWRVKW